jgi:uncharacterized membrane protein
MKNYLISAYIMAMCYILGAFINWDVNAGNWSEFARLTVVLSWFFACFGLVTYEVNNETT